MLLTELCLSDAMWENCFVIIIMCYCLIDLGTFFDVFKELSPHAHYIIYNI